MKLNLCSRSLLFLYLMFISSVSSAEDLGSIKSTLLGLELNHYRYVEPGLIAHSGLMLGISGELAIRYLDQLEGVTAAQVVFGELTYDGSLCDVNTNVCSDYKAKTSDIIAKVSHRVDYLSDFGIHFFIGPGFRFLIDKGIGSGFYTRIGNYLYAPIGFNFLFKDIKFDFEYDVFISGSMYSKLSEVNKTFGNVRHTQTTGSGHKVTLSRRIDDLTTVPLVASLYYESWTVGDSNTEELQVNGQPSGNFFIEPKNFTQVIGLNFSFLF